MAERPRVYYAYGSAVSGATHLVWHSEANDADVPAPEGDYVRESDYADLEAERDEWQDMCTEAQAQLSAARSERDEWKRRAEAAEANLDYYRNGYQGSCTACEPVAEKNRKLEAERDEWQRRAETAERLLDIADDHATASLAEYAASDTDLRAKLATARAALWLIAEAQVLGPGVRFALSDARTAASEALAAIDAPQLSESENDSIKEDE